MEEKRRTVRQKVLEELKVERVVIVSILRLGLVALGAEVLQLVLDSRSSQMGYQQRRSLKAVNGARYRRRSLVRTTKDLVQQVANTILDEEKLAIGVRGCDENAKNASEEVQQVDVRVCGRLDGFLDLRIELITEFFCFTHEKATCLDRHGDSGV
jgi:hypothetical protein